LRAQGALQLVELPVAHRAEQDGVGFLRELERRVGQRVAVGFIGRAADEGGFHLELQVEDVQDLDGLGDDFGADAVARQDCDLHGVWLGQGFASVRRTFSSSAALGTARPTARNATLSAIVSSGWITYEMLPPSCSRYARVRIAGNHTSWPSRRSGSLDRPSGAACTASSLTSSTLK